MPDLTHLGLPAFLGLLLLIAAFDTATAIVLAIVQGTFSTAYVLAFLTKHVLLRVYIIFSLAVLGSGIAPLGIPPIQAAGAAAAIALGLYVVETVGSLKANLDNSSGPAPA